jgi:hypothetical protein
MKSKITEGHCINSIEYPCLVVFDYESSENHGLVVFKYSKVCGMVVHAPDGSGHTMGEYLDSWSVSNFVEFNGSVELSN